MSRETALNNIGDAQVLISAKILEICKILDQRSLTMSDMEKYVQTLSDLLPIYDELRSAAKDEPIHRDVKKDSI